MDKENDTNIKQISKEGIVIEDKNVIEISDLKLSFGNNAVLQGIDLEVKKGETVVVLGKSGTGKSVLLKCIVRLIMSDSGKINVLGMDVLTLNDKELVKLRTKIGFIFQQAALYDSMTVRENLEFPLERHENLDEDEHNKRIEEVLESVSQKESIDKMPSELSGGMRKRIGVARTLILKPEIMLWDEPTTGLDPATSREISYLIVKMQKDFNVSSIVVTHDMSCAKIVSDRIVVLKDGKFIIEGTYEELSKSDDEFVKSFFEEV
ncbi:MAG: ATP-binding cassette domain-containing protein [Ignavibacteriae bacterium]|nr:MAG: ATP-binding cassette domain-containing protein [Ignavibacteriota bacterium]